VTVTAQDSLFDEPEPADESGQRVTLAGRVRRTELSAGAWVDVVPGWWPGADALFARLVGAVRWRAERRVMYERVVDVPRLVAHFDEGAPVPDPDLDLARRVLNDWYEPQLGEPILSLGAPRVLALRRRGGGPTMRHQLGHGDLLVMGGSCQRTFEHAVPKTRRLVGPRISVQFRPRGVR
jgi:alkylated DNA repair dioxygenase AlkB